MRRGSTALLAVAPLALLAALGSSLAVPGVVYEIETTDYRESPALTDVAELRVEGPHVAMGFSGAESGRMVFNGERREMVVINDDDQSYMLIDEEGLQALSSQINSMMAEMEEMLAQLPAEQRALVERMGAQGMPGMPDMAAAPPEIDVRKSGRSDTKAGFRSEEWEVYEDGELRRRLWVAPWSEIEGADEVREAITGMVDFFDDFLDAMPTMPGSDRPMAENPFRHFDLENGFPVVTHELDERGEIEQESTLRSAERRTLDPADFEPPAGYKRQQMFGG